VKILFIDVGDRGKFGIKKENAKGYHRRLDSLEEARALSREILP
jgi:hypothetical protein